MKQVHIHGKVFDDTDFKNLVIGGQNNADTIQFVLPKIFGNEIDFSSSDWIFTITYVNKEGEGDAVLLTKSDSSKSENIYLDWKPSQTATQVEGKLTCQLSGTKKNTDTDEVSRFTTKPFAIYVDKYLSPEPITQMLPSVIEQALEMMAEYNADVQHAIQVGEAAEEHANAAAGSASESESFSKISERYAKGTESGEAVSSGAGFQDNALYYKNLCFEAKEAAEAARNEAESIVNAEGAISTVISENLTQNRVLISTSNGKIAASEITTTLLNYLSGLTGNVQTQITSKLNSSALTLKNASYTAL